MAQVSVTGSGTAAYSHAIAVPPGVSGMQPNLGLRYASGGLNGPVGHGWSLQGVSAITRCPSTVKVDGVSRGVAFGPGDQLCLDGQRLIQTDASGTPASFPQTSNAMGVLGGYREYRLENDTFSRVRAYGVSGGMGTLITDSLLSFNGPQYFKVWTKAGQVYEYGASPSVGTLANASVKAQGTAKVAVWAVARISDVKGNYIDFRYEQRDVAWGSVMPDGPAVGREWNLKEVHYTGNTATGSVPTAKVVLTYVDRTDGAEAYQNGSKNVSVRRLDKIETYVNSANPTALGPAAGAILVKRIALGYSLNPSTIRSRLTTITECNGAGVCQNPVSFTYQNGGDETFKQNLVFAGGALPTTPMYTSERKFGTEVIDYDGDGRADLLRWGGVDPTQNKLYRSNGDGSFTEVTAFNIKGADEGLFSDGGCQGSILTDFNGDGLVDILRYSKVGDTGCGAKPTYLYLNQGTGAFTRVTVTAPDLAQRRGVIGWCTKNESGSSDCMPAQGATFYVLDVDGDGKPDIVRSTSFGNSEAAGCSASSRCTWVYKGAGDGTFTLMPTSPTVQAFSLYQWSSGAALNQQSDVIDVDGDGLQDIVLPGKIWRSLGNGDFELLTQSTEVADCKNKLDYNGDGRSDCLYPSSARKSKLMASTGMLLKKATNFDDAWGMLGGSYGVRMVDLNADGRTDLIRWSDDGTQTWALISKGDGTFAKSSSFNLNTDARRLVTSGGSFTFVNGDFLGNGSQQILRLKESPAAGEGTSNQLYVRTDPSVPDLLVSVLSPSGLKTTISYASMVGSGRYAGDRGTIDKAIYPMVDLTVAAPVITTVETDTGVGSNKTRTEYAYRGMKAALDGRGVLGFRQTTQQTTGPEGSAVTVRTNYLMDKPYAGVARSTETRLGTWDQPGAPLLSRTTNVYCDRSSGADPNTATDAVPCPTSAKLTRPYLRKSVEEGWDLNGAVLPVVTTVNTYNDYGDPTAITVTTQAAVAGAPRSYTKTTSNTFCAPDSANCPNKTSGDNWILGRLTASTVTASAPDLRSALTTSPGGAAQATATAGTLPAGASLPVNPAVLSVILQFLLED
ncbi:FG-GAP-like repeat-containing protein [Aquincola sp. MAHUQ-54]|uniref:FG-GAP-like repeat-containing protein n=2 Tax=Aquincola TaxID=391952 RepID=A0AAW9QG45_9BURK